MIIAIRIVGIFLILLGTANLAGLLIIDSSTLISLPTVVIRYSLMVISGIGFLLTYRWGFLVYAISVAFNWIALFVVYEGESAGPLWASIPIPIVIAGLTYLAWGNMKSLKRPEVINDA